MLPEVNEDFVLAKCHFLASTQVWPLRSKLDPEGWLANFEACDRKMSLQLLNSFMYFSDDLLDRMFVSAVQGLSRRVTAANDSLSRRTAEWCRFLDGAVFTYPTGEKPFVGDSGHLFVRRARDLIGLDEKQVLSPERAIERIATGSSSDVVFLDDFVGTGQQFRKTWCRRYNRASDSFESLTQSRAFRAFYCPVFCTRHAADELIRDFANSVIFAPSHWLTPQHSLFSNESLWWPTSMRPDVHDFIRKYSMKLGLPDTGGYDTRDWQAYEKQGLAIAFRHCCPDATIPLFDTIESGWCPLWKRQ